MRRLSLVLAIALAAAPCGLVAACTTTTNDPARPGLGPATEAPELDARAAPADAAGANETDAADEAASDAHGDGDADAHGNDASPEAATDAHADVHHD
jgi:hypothetical protein